jgi:hypothetical protein
MRFVKLVDDRDTVAAVVEPKPQRTPARQALAHAIAELKQRQAEVEDAGKPAERLRGAIKAHEDAKWQFELCQTSDRQKLARAIASGGEVGRAFSEKTAAAHATMTALAEPAAAAAMALPGGQPVHRNP